MMIPILKDYYAAGYLPGAGPRAIPPYLPNVSLAVRRGLLDDIGGYDDACVAGEDADLCVRAARAGWSQFFDPAACTWHEPRPSLAGLIRQWTWYAEGGSHFFFKLQERRLEVYVDMELTPKMHRYRRVWATRFFPVPAMVFLSPFPLFHVVALMIVLGLAAGYRVAALLLLLLGLGVFGLLFRRSPLRRLSWRELSLYAGVAYVVNWTCMLGSLRAGIRNRRLFFYPGI